MQVRTDGYKPKRSILAIQLKGKVQNNLIAFSVLNRLLQNTHVRRCRRDTAALQRKVSTDTGHRRYD